ncbi:N-dimethylarginine dimethylaminohydrolase [Nocardiopsis mwathae]|uniref:N-dimethylarginine dimethylaminohydrolase n=1 Tax=Nocardiopsis mwathae TaxID=1472723 RepID=A0A7W9YLY7_9ACTN|nr:scyllo-inosamine-4-phosphate amidinotransferase [Nocardiopsis mwathae]MBB6174610.1 N-dimethylarginine dimethylaminohydrolase [Nocardiopsis mwathae]
MNHSAIASSEGSDSPSGKAPVHSWDEFTTLREVIVGDATHARIPDQTDPSAWLNCYPDLSPAELAGIETGCYPHHIVEESNEDLSVLVDTLRKLGITVHQPAAVDHGLEYGGLTWRTSGRSSYCPRDLTLVVGSAIIESPSPMRARYFEALGLRPLFQDYLLQGAHWFAAPRPRLDDTLYEYDQDGFPLLGEAEPAFEAANCLRLGRDVFYQVSRSGNEMGLRWLESTMRLLGDIRVHPMRGIYDGTHIDSTIALLRPGLVLLNPERITPDTIPDLFKGWDVIWSPPMRVEPTAVPHTLSTPWVGMNLLMVDEETAVVDGTQTELIRVLERHGITAIPLVLRHSRVLGGGFHCVTLDVVRDGGPQDYLD